MCGGLLITLNSSIYDTFPEHKSQSVDRVQPDLWVGPVPELRINDLRQKIV